MEFASLGKTRPLCLRDDPRDRRDARPFAVIRAKSHLSEFGVGLAGHNKKKKKMDASEIRAAPAQPWVRLKRILEHDRKPWLS